MVFEPAKFSLGKLTANTTTYKHFVEEIKQLRVLFIHSTADDNFQKRRGRDKTGMEEGYKQITTLTKV